jgi:hypothetical protein
MVGSEFDMRGPESRYYAHKLFFSLPKRLELMSSGRRRVFVTLRSRLSFFRARYDSLNPANKSPRLSVIGSLSARATSSSFE